MVVVVTPYSSVRRFTDTHDPAPAMTPFSSLLIMTGASFSSSHCKKNHRAAETDVTGRSDDIQLTPPFYIVSAVGKIVRSLQLFGTSELRMRSCRPILSWNLPVHTELNLTEPQDS